MSKIEKIEVDYYSSIPEVLLNVVQKLNEVIDFLNNK